MIFNDVPKIQDVNGFSGYLLVDVPFLNSFTQSSVVNIKTDNKRSFCLMGRNTSRFPLRNFVPEFRNTFYKFFLLDYLKYIVSFTVQNHNTLVEMVMFHRASSIQNSQR